MSTSSGKPNVIIFGGLNTCSRALVTLLVPLEGERLVEHLRIIDKFSINPPTTYLGSEFPKILDKPDVEYKQANLTIPSVVVSSFDPPEGKAPYSYVFDFTGETKPDRSEPIFINNTFHLSNMLGREAAKRKIKAYIRIAMATYDTPETGPHNEKQKQIPKGIPGIWYHESFRALANMEDLNLVLLQAGFMYGPYINFGMLSTVLAVAACYAYMKKPMKLLWGPGKEPLNCVHIEDIAGAMWAAALWMDPLGRKQANALGGEEILFLNDKKSVIDIPGVVPFETKLVAPLFNIVDDSELTLNKAAQIITSVFGITHEFYNMITNTMAKFKLEDVVEEINDHHVSTWTEMGMASNPPINQTPHSAYMDTFLLQKRRVCYDNSKIKEVVGYKLKRPQFEKAILVDIIDKWKAEGTWPILEGQ